MTIWLVFQNPVTYVNFLIHFVLYSDTAATSIFCADAAYLCSSCFKQQLYCHCSFIITQFPCVTVALSSNLCCQLFILMQLQCVTVALSSNRCSQLFVLMQPCCVHITISSNHHCSFCCNVALLCHSCFKQQLLLLFVHFDVTLLCHSCFYVATAATTVYFDAALLCHSCFNKQHLHSYIVGQVSGLTQDTAKQAKMYNNNNRHAFWKNLVDKFKLFPIPKFCHNTFDPLFDPSKDIMLDIEGIKFCRIIPGS